MFRYLQIFLKACLPSLRNIHHEAILALLKAGKYSNCLSLCDKVIACYHKGQDHYLDTQFSVDSSQMSDVVSSANLSEHQNENNNDFLNNNFNHNIMDNEPRVRYDNMAGTQTLKRKRQDSDSEPSSSVIGNLNFDIKGQSVSHDSKDNSCMADESNEIDKLTCDVIALKYKANVLEKMAETNAAIDCLERSVATKKILRPKQNVLFPETLLTLLFWDLL